jgi:hypothetical protein
LLNPWFCNNGATWIWTGNYAISFPRFSFGTWFFASKIKIYQFLSIFPVEDMGSFVAGRDQQQSIFKKKSNKLRIDDAGKTELFSSRYLSIMR